jgi:transcriptional regulator with XRE-family HTH domain
MRAEAQPGTEHLLNAYSIGPKLRLLRNERSLTLARLGAETGYSTALLSKLESERMIPTLQTLARISRVYGVDLGYFFSSVTHHSLSITRRAHISDDPRGQQAAKEKPLQPYLGTRKQVSQIIDIPAGVMFDAGQSGARTELTAYVLRGTLRMSTAGMLDTVDAGDCFVLETDGAVFWISGDSGCRVLVVLLQS